MARPGPRALIAAALPALILALILALIPAGPAEAHRMDYRVDTRGAVSVTLSLGNGPPPSHESYRVFAPGEESAFQTGRTDARGRLSFVPDRPGNWRVTVATEDGHGLELEVEVDSEGVVEGVAGPGTGGWMMLGAGVGYLLGAAGLLALWRRRRGGG